MWAIAASDNLDHGTSQLDNQFGGYNIASVLDLHLAGCALDHHAIIIIIITINNNDNDNTNNVYICFAIISGSGMCDARQLPPDRLVLSITSDGST